MTSTSTPRSWHMATRARASSASGPAEVKHSSGTDWSRSATGPCSRSAELRPCAEMYEVSISFSAASRAEADE